MIVDLFAGPGGWDVGAHLLGLEPLGIEWDDAAVATRHAAGLRTVQADVSALDPHEVLAAMCGRRGQHIAACDEAERCGNCDGSRTSPPLSGLIASPPCQAFSMAGKGAGRKATRVLDEAMADLGLGRPIDRAALDAACQDERAHLVLEPLRWALALQPRWVACEQVEPVLPLWESMGAVLRRHGYAVWTGVLSSERYGVPQTRRRAILLARRDGVNVVEPPATHQRYVAPRRRDEATLGLFDAPEPERIVLAEEEHLLPWVSMAEALGWAAGLPIDHHRGAGMTERHGERTPRHTGQPAPTVTAGAGRRSGGTRWTVNTGRDWKAGGSRDDAQAFDADERPAPAIDGEGRWHVSLAAGTNVNDAERDADEPAPTLRFGARLNTVEWKLRPTNDRPNASERPADAPAPTLAFGNNAPTWVGERPATTVAGDPRVHPPGHKLNGDDERAGRDGYEGRAGVNAVRVEQEEALVLQSFPPDYPVQGTKSKRFEQIGNAVPPLLARACLQAVGADAGVQDEQEAAA